MLGELAYFRAFEIASWIIRSSEVSNRKKAAANHQRYPCISTPESTALSGV